VNLTVTANHGISFNASPRQTVVTFAVPVGGTTAAVPACGSTATNRLRQQPLASTTAPPRFTYHFAPGLPTTAGKLTCQFHAPSNGTKSVTAARAVHAEIWGNQRPETVQTAPGHSIAGSGILMHSCCPAFLGIVFNRVDRVRRGLRPAYGALLLILGSSTLYGWWGPAGGQH